MYDVGAPPGAGRVGDERAQLTAERRTGRGRTRAQEKERNEKTCGGERLNG